MKKCYPPLPMFFADLFFICSVVGIWPRHIEPRLLYINKLNYSIPKLSGLRIVQLSDLHLQKRTSAAFLQKITRAIEKLSPDLIVFTGDFICRSHLEEGERLKRFLSTLKAPLGCYATLGNHDYANYVSRTRKGDYGLVSGSTHALFGGLRELIKTPSLTKPQVTPEARATPFHAELMALLKETPFEVLHNETRQIAGFNLVGLGDYWLGRCQPEIAFQTYDPLLPGIVLTHNPDSFAHLHSFPGELVLAGHTHGGQINLPGIRERLVKPESPQWMRGLQRTKSKALYINRGLGSAYPLRLFSPPELLLVTL